MKWRGMTVNKTPGESGTYVAVNAATLNPAAGELTVDEATVTLPVNTQTDANDFTVVEGGGRFPVRYGLTVPTATGALTYTGTTQGPAWPTFAEGMVAVSGQTTAVDAGEYTTVFTPTNRRCVWMDGSSAPKQVRWTISKGVVTMPTVTGEVFTYSGASQGPIIGAYDDTFIAVTGDLSATNAGDYAATFSLTDPNVEWADGTIAPKQVQWTISKAAGTASLSTSSVSLNASTPTQVVTVTRTGDGAVSAVSSDPCVEVAVNGTQVIITGVATGSATVTVSVATGTNHLAPASMTVDVAVQLVTVYGMVLTKEGGRVGTWKRVDQNFNTVAFNASSHGTWAGMKTVKDGSDVLVEIPTTWVKSEVLQSGPYKGKTCWWTADGPVKGFHVHPAFMKPNGTPGTLRVGAYMARKGTSNQPMSTDGGATASNYWSSIAYNSVHSTGLTKNNFSGKAGYRAYSIYDHHLLARLMLTEFGTPDVQSVSGWDGSTRVTYRGVHDPFGLPDSTFYYWLDGFTTVNGVYNVLNPNGSGTMVNTGVSRVGSGVWPVNCRVDTANGVNFGDLFIASAANSTEANGSFADCQNLNSGRAFNVDWGTNSGYGAFYLDSITPSHSNWSLGWRVAQVV